MKNLIYILLILSLFIGLHSCGSGDEPGITPPTPTEFTKDDLIGTWEIYHSKKDFVLDGDIYRGFRDPEMDGFCTKFLKENGTYKFINYNPIQEIIDQGTYDIENGHIVFTVNKFDGRDTLYTTKQNVTSLKINEGLMYVDYSYSLTIEGKVYKISDIRRLRNVVTAPGAHPNVDKITINFDDYVGTWEVFDYVIFVNNSFNQTESDRYLDKPNITTFKFFYNEKRQKMGSKSTYYPVKDSIAATEPMPVIIIDDVIHLLFKFKTDWGSIENDGIFLWITSREPYTDPITNKQTEKILDRDELRDKDKPTDLYEIRRYLKKIE